MSEMTAGGGVAPEMTAPWWFTPNGETPDDPLAPDLSPSIYEYPSLVDPENFVMLAPDAQIDDDNIDLGGAWVGTGGGNPNLPSPGGNPTPAVNLIPNILASGIEQIGQSLGAATPGVALAALQQGVLLAGSAEVLEGNIAPWQLSQLLGYAQGHVQLNWTFLPPSNFPIPDLREFALAPDNVQITTQDYLNVIAAAEVLGPVGANSGDSLAAAIGNIGHAPGIPTAWQNSAIKVAGSLGFAQNLLNQFPSHGITFGPLG